MYEQGTLGNPKAGPGQTGTKERPVLDNATTNKWSPVEPDTFA